MLVSVPNLATYMDITFSLRQQDAAEMVLEGLQNELELYLRRPIEPTQFTEQIRIDSGHTGVPMSSFLTNDQPYDDSFYSGSPVNTTQFATPPESVYVKNTPIVSITQVRVKPLNGTERILTVDVDYVKKSWGIDYFYAFANDLITITYTAGLDGSTIPAFKLLILRAATREMQNMHDDVVGVKDLNPRGVAPMVTGFLDSELASVRKYRRVRVA